MTKDFETLLRTLPIKISTKENGSVRLSDTDIAAILKAHKAEIQAVQNEWNEAITAERKAHTEAVVAAAQGASAISDEAKTATSKQVVTFDELKARMEKALYDLYYAGEEAGTDETLQYQFEREPAYRHRYADRVIKGSRNEMADILASVIDLANKHFITVPGRANPPVLRQPAEGVESE